MKNRVKIRLEDHKKNTDERLTVFQLFLQNGKKAALADAWAAVEYHGTAIP